MAWRRSRRESGEGLEVTETTTRAVQHRAAVVVRTCGWGAERGGGVGDVVQREREQLVCVFFRKILLLEPGLGGRGSWVCAGMVRGAERKRSAVTAC